MHSLTEISTWTYEDAEAALQVALPAGWNFNYAQDQDHTGLYEGAIRDAAGVEQWRGMLPDLRLLLLDAYGFLSLRGYQGATTGLWAVRRQELTSSIVQKRALEIPDPDDLVPTEIEALYHLQKDEDEDDDS